MSKSIAKYDRGSRVKVKGRSGIQIIDWPLILNIPVIEDGEYKHIERAAYKFNALKPDTFYAWETDITPAAKETAREVNRVNQKTVQRGHPNTNKQRKNVLAKSRSRLRK